MLSSETTRVLTLPFVYDDASGEIYRKIAHTRDGISMIVLMFALLSVRREGLLRSGMYFTIVELAARRPRGRTIHTMVFNDVCSLCPHVPRSNAANPASNQNRSFDPTLASQFMILFETLVCGVQLPVIRVANVGLEVECFDNTQSSRQPATQSAFDESSHPH